MLSDFVYSFFEHNLATAVAKGMVVVNCFQILYIRSLNTTTIVIVHSTLGCELLSDFVYSFFEHNFDKAFFTNQAVVNCFQILYIRSLNTTRLLNEGREDVL